MRIHMPMRAVSLLGGLGAAATIALVPGTAHASTLDGLDPIRSGCAGSAITAEIAGLVSSDGGISNGVIELRYSTVCRTVWARVITGFQHGYALVHRNSGGSEFCGTALTWSQSLYAYTCYTPMLDDSNMTSYAAGADFSASGTETGQTASY